MLTCERIPITTDGAGAADVKTTRPLNGRICEIRVASTALNETAKADWTVTRAEDGGAVLALTNIDGPWSRSPRQPLHDTAGAAALFAAAGTAQVDKIPVSGYLRVQLAQAKPNTKGELLVYFE